MLVFIAVPVDVKLERMESAAKSETTAPQERRDDVRKDAPHRVLLGIILDALVGQVIFAAAFCLCVVFSLLRVFRLFSSLGLHFGERRV